MADLNAEIPDDLMKKFKAALVERDIKLVKTGVAAALADWVAKDPKAPVTVRDECGSTSALVSADLLELVKQIQTFFLTKDPKWSGVSQFLKNELQVFISENPLE